MTVFTIGGGTGDDKDPWPDPPASPAGYPLEHWSTHLAAFEPSGTGSRDRTPVITTLVPNGSASRVH